MPYKSKLREKEYKANYHQKNRQRIIERMRQWERDNPERKRENHRKYYHRHKKEISEKLKIVRKKNPEKYRRRAKEYYQKNKDKALARKRKWRDENREKYRRTNRDYYKRVLKNSEDWKRRKRLRDTEYRNRPENKLKMKLYGKEYRPKNRKRRAMNNKKYKQTGKGKNARRRELVKTYGLTVDQYDKILEQQGGGCAICGGQNKDGRRLFVDHAHDTGKTRGLLCVKCNLFLGATNDSVDILSRAITYLNKFREGL